MGAEWGILGSESCTKQLKSGRWWLEATWKFLSTGEPEQFRGRWYAFDPLADARPEFCCPACGAPVYQGERYFTDGRGRVIACEHCPSALA